MSRDTELTNIDNFDVNRIVFLTPSVTNIPNSSITFKRIFIKYKNDNGTVGDLVMETEELFSFGVSENRGMDSNVLNGYTMPLCLWDKNGATDRQKRWTDILDQITESCKTHLLENRDEIEKYDLEKSDLKKFVPSLWRKMEKGKPVDGSGPTLYCKLISTKDDTGNIKITSMFYDSETGDEIDPKQLQGTYCTAKCAIKVESIYIGTKCSLQLKLWEAHVQVHQKGMRRLIGGNKGNKLIVENGALPEEEEEFQAAESDGSLSESDEEPEPEEEAKPAPKRRVGRKAKA